MMKIRKNQLVILLLTALIAAAILLQGFFQVEQGVEPVGFIFIFLGYITLFFVFIPGERPQLCRSIFPLQLRAPPFK